MRNYFCFAVVLVIACLPTLGQEPNPKASQVTESGLPRVKVWDLLESGDLAIVTGVEELPKNVRRSLAQVLHQTELEMGDRDHKVNAHCPDCLVFRLIFAGISPDGCFVYYSATGLGLYYEIIVFDTKTQKGTRPLWGARAAPARGARANNLDELRTSIAEGKFYPSPIP